MTNNHDPQDDFQTRAALFALGALPADEAQDFALALQQASDEERAEATAFTEAAAQLHFAADEAAPSANVRALLLDRIAPSATPAALQNAVPYQAPAPTHLDVMAGEGKWRQLYDGVFCKMLFQEPTNGYVTTLLKIEPGGSLPNHQHHGAEQCLVISGEVWMNEQKYSTGDFTVALTGSTHRNLHSKIGALVLLVSPPDYELLAH